MKNKYKKTTLLSSFDYSKQVHFCQSLLRFYNELIAYFDILYNGSEFIVRSNIDIEEHFWFDAPN